MFFFYHLPLQQKIKVLRRFPSFIFVPFFNKQWKINSDQEVPLENGSGTSPQDVTNTAAELLRQGAACNVVYLGSIDTESLTGPEVNRKACFN